MRTPFLSRCALSIGVAALLSGCGGAQPPIGASGAMPQSRAIVAHADRAGSWMLPEANKENLLYVASAASAKANHERILIFTYPQGKLVGQLTGFSYPMYGLCINHARDLFVADFYGQEVREFAPGGTNPILTLHTHGSPFGCAVDPTNGDLAVMNWCDGPIGSCFNDGTVLIYAKGRGKPRKLTDPNISSTSFCTYDGSGDLFLNGLASAFYTDTYDELPRGKSTFVTLALEKVPEGQQPGGIQWSDGALAVAPAAGDNLIYRYEISGSRGARLGVTKLGAVPFRNGVIGFWVQKQTLVAPEWNIKARQGIGRVQFFQYPSGGKPISTIDHAFYFPTAAVVSLAARHE